jgi:hypothetical protein
VDLVFHPPVQGAFVAGCEGALEALCILGEGVEGEQQGHDDQHRTASSRNSTLDRSHGLRYTHHRTKFEPFLT